MLPFNLNIPEYSNQAVGIYSPMPANAMSITNIPSFDGYTFDEKSGKYYKSTQGNAAQNTMGRLFGRGFTAEQLSKKNNSNNQFAPNNIQTYTSPEHQYNALANMMTPNDVMTMMTSAGYNPSGAGRFANTAYGGGLLGK